MINEWEEFCAYTGTVSYTASKKSDTTGFCEAAGYSSA